MQIHTTLQKGSYHPQHNEDFLITANIGHGRLLCAIMDGCTMGIDSHFASTLTGKVLRRIAVEHDYRAFYENGQPPVIADQLKAILKELISTLKTVKQQLLLDPKELLTTLLLLITDNKHGQLLAIGDGVAHINGQLTVFDQDNRPDYLGYHLEKDFEDWYGAQTQRLYFEQPEDVSIASDGVLLFERTTAEISNINPMEYLLRDSSRADKADMLELKLKTLEFEHGLVPGDDLAIIRLLRTVPAH
ncbi:protein phosphatase 2C domain-containing protein [Chitinophaga sedimenti]|uniref:protein phosphatase 2C domain-containing protein n=1 Tax=Chitinophaga sedimenti TaxID=2033606 RepID=UPI00200412C2|nr:protein phosphatase 2C domain-containing protein [Chitinophaga sedimenti]MCK7556918.1 protein phosphatase 2C domain-containing protein [Chitinophaga sedimenti]